MSHFQYFNTGNRDSSADYFVDGKTILQVNDYHTYYTWHCGDGKGKYGITNQNSVGIEMCINSDGDHNKAFDNLVAVTKHLMQELNIPAERVVRHYDASRKNCPASMNNGTWSKWNEFKSMIEEDIDMAKLEELENRIAKLENKMVYNYIDTNMPDWARPTIQKLVDKGYLKGDGNGLGLTDEMLKIFVILDRAGEFE
nr:MAG TPA: N-acetylmuramoyl-L-alanine amidase [Caudoviricetes sp.]